MEVVVLKIEKLDDDKIRITLNLDDLKEKNIDFHSFMSDPLESQSVVLDMLDAAEKEIGFVTKDYKITIEAMATSNGTFVLTVTRDKTSAPPKKKVHIKRKSVDLNKPVAIYSFASFEDLCLFCKFLENSNLNAMLGTVDTISFHELEGKYYLRFSKIHSNLVLLKGFCSSITEFANYVPNSDLFEGKLMEHGTTIVAKEAVKVLSRYFI